MTDQTAGQLQQPQADASARGGAAVTDKMPPPAAAPTLTMSRGTRPLIVRRLPNGDQPGPRRRSA